MADNLTQQALAEAARLRDNYGAGYGEAQRLLVECATELTALREAVKSANERADFYNAVDEFLDAEKHPADALLRWHRTRTERKEGE